MIEFEMPGLPPGPNVKVRWHWARRAKSDQQWRGDAYYAAVAARNASHLSDPIEHARMTITFYIPTLARRDPDNLLSSVKQVIDGIRDAKVIVDDDYRHLELIHKIEYRKGNPGLRVVVEPL